MTIADRTEIDGLIRRRFGPLDVCPLCRRYLDGAEQCGWCGWVES